MPRWNCLAYHLMAETLLLTARVLSADACAADTRSRRRYRLAYRARDFMLDHSASPPTIAQICAFINASERTLHSVFSDVYQVSPKQFLKAQRLFAARQALKAAEPGEQVSTVAMGLGFWEMGRFPWEYRVMFGELPSQTLSQR